MSQVFQRLRGLIFGASRQQNGQFCHLRENHVYGDRQDSSPPLKRLFLLQRAPGRPDQIEACQAHLQEVIVSRRPPSDGQPLPVAAVLFSRI